MLMTRAEIEPFLCAPRIAVLASAIVWWRRGAGVLPLIGPYACR